MGVSDIFNFGNLLKRYLEAPISTKLKYAILGFCLFQVFKGYMREKGLWIKHNIAGKHVFLTGGAMGLGKNVSKRLLKLGCKVTIADMNTAQLKVCEEEIKQLNLQNYNCVFCDVTDPESIKEAAENARQKFGIVDILINNAGIVSGKGLLEASFGLIDKTMSVNTTAHHYTVKQFLPDMMQKKQGHVVTIASLAGYTGCEKLIDYCASKHGAVGFSESLRMELRAQNLPNIKTTCINPYFINTGMFDGVKTKFPLVLDILDEQYAAQRIVYAIQQQEAEVFLPFICNFLVMLKFVLPTWWADEILVFFGANDAMTDFKGRTKK